MQDPLTVLNYLKGSQTNRYKATHSVIQTGSIHKTWDLVRHANSQALH